MTGGYEDLRVKMVEELEKRGYITQHRVKQVMQTVPRHRFVDAQPFEAYEDRPIRIKEINSKVISTISQPSLVAHMLEELEIEEGCRILEIGTGLGYNAALLGCLVGLSGLVITIEYDQELALKAKQLLESYLNIVSVHGDGREGCVQHAPFQRIMATVTASDIYPEWQEQLISGGLILAPLEYFPGFTRLIKLRKTEQGFSGRFGWAVNFVGMPGGRLEEPLDLAAIQRFLVAKSLERKEMDSFLFFCLCSGLEPEDAMKKWNRFGMPSPENLLISEHDRGGLKLRLPSLELYLSPV